MLCINCEKNEAQPESEFCSGECRNEAIAAIRDFLMNAPLSEIQDLHQVNIDDPIYHQLVNQLEAAIVKKN